MTTAEFGYRSKPRTVVLQEAGEARMDELMPLSSPRSALSLQRRKAMQPLEKGQHKVVYPHGRDRVIAFLPLYLADPELLKQEFYRIKLVHTLLPKNIPDVHFVGSQPPVIIRDRIEQAPRPKSVFGTARSIRKQKLLAGKMESMGIYADIDNPGNFMINQEGEPVYIDDFNLSYQGMVQAISQLRATDQPRAFRYLERAGAMPL